MLQLLLLLPLGILAGLLSGFLGIGGGLIFSPLLLALGLEPHQALATSTLAIVPTTAAGSWAHWRQGRLPLQPALVIALAALASGLAFALVGKVLSGWHLLAVQALVYAPWWLHWCGRASSPPALMKQAIPPLSCCPLPWWAASLGSAAACWAWAAAW